MDPIVATREYAGIVTENFSVGQRIKVKIEDKYISNVHKYYAGRYGVVVRSGTSFIGITIDGDIMIMDDGRILPKTMFFYTTCLEKVLTRLGSLASKVSEIV